MKKSTLLSQLNKNVLNILQKTGNNSTPANYVVKDLAKLQERAVSMVEKNALIYDGVVSNLSVLKKYARASRRGVQSVPFAWRRNKKFLFGEFANPKTYINYMKGLEYFAEGNLDKAENLLDGIAIDADKYYGRTNSVQINNFLYPVCTGRYIKASDVSIQDELFNDFDFASICHPTAEKQARFGKITYRTTEGKQETIEFAFNNAVAFEVVARRAIAALDPEKVSSISLQETIKTTRKTKTRSRSANGNEAKVLINSCKNFSNIYFGEHKFEEKKSFWQKVKDFFRGKKKETSAEATEETVAKANEEAVAPETEEIAEKLEPETPTPEEQQSNFDPQKMIEHMKLYAAITSASGAVKESFTPDPIQY